MPVQGSPIRVSGESRHFRGYRLDCAALSAAGGGRPHNEDRCIFAGPGMEAAEDAGSGYLFAVIDGVAEGGKGRSAANETASSLMEILEDPRCAELRPDLMLHRLQDANTRCERFIKGQCAATALWIWEDPSSALCVAWAHVGDTRLYHHNGTSWRRVTRDHARGRLLDRAVGQGSGLVVDTGQLRAGVEERWVLVSDGVWRTAPIPSVLPGRPFPTAAESVRRLVGQARLNGTPEDTSAIVIVARSADTEAEPEH